MAQTKTGIIKKMLYELLLTKERRDEVFSNIVDAVAEAQDQYDTPTKFKMHINHLQASQVLDLDRIEYCCRQLVDLCNQSPKLLDLLDIEIVARGGKKTD